MNLSYKLLIAILFAFLSSCKSNTSTKPIDSVERNSANIADTVLPGSAVKSAAEAIDTFEKDIYLKIDKVHSGNIFTNSNGDDCFYRILEIPEEENIMLVAEKISIGDEGGNYKLIKRIKLSGQDAPLGYSFNSSGFVAFRDSVTIKGKAGKDFVIDLEKLQ